MPGIPHALPQIQTELPRTTRRDQTWWKGRPLSEGINAHRTNTREQLTAALGSNANWFEADLRREINSPHGVECRHDEGQEDGDNLTLKQWLDITVPSGRGLKLDVKEPEALPEILDMVAASRLPSERLMVNLGAGAMAKWGAEIHRRFPDATLGINPKGSSVDGKISDAQMSSLLNLAKKVGQPATFVVPYNLLTDEAIKTLTAVAPISPYNDAVDHPVADVNKTTAELRKRGVTGIINLRPGPAQSLPVRVVHFFSDVFG